MAIKNGAMIEVDPKTEKILKVYIVASKDQDQAAIIRAIISKANPSALPLVADGQDNTGKGCHLNL